MKISPISLMHMQLQSKMPHGLKFSWPLPTAAPAPLCARRAPAPPSPAAGRPAPPPRRAGGGGGRSRDPRRRPLPPAGHMQRGGASQAPGGSPGARPAASEASPGVKMATSAARGRNPQAGPLRSALPAGLGAPGRGGDKERLPLPVSAIAVPPAPPPLLPRVRGSASAAALPARPAPLWPPAARCPPQRDPSAVRRLAKMCWHRRGLKE